jgi:hypothetical protein
MDNFLKIGQNQLGSHNSASKIVYHFWRQCHSFIAAPITADLSHRDPATAGTAAVLTTTPKETYCI